MAETDGLLSIGTFSALVQISARMLRYYDQHDILIPAFTDPLSGYRFYDGDQVAQARLIRSLREGGLPVSAIAAVLAEPTSAQMVAGVLRAHRVELLTESATVRRQLAQLDHLFTHLSEVPMTDITTRTIPGRTILALRKVVADRRGQMQLWETLAHAAGEVDLPERPTTGGVTYFDDGYRDRDIDIAVWVPISASVPVAAPLVCQDVEEHTAIVAIHRGPHTLSAIR